MRGLWNRILLKSAIDQADAESARLTSASGSIDAHLELAHRIRHRLVDVDPSARDEVEWTLLRAAVSTDQDKPSELPAAPGALRSQLQERVEASRKASERASRLRWFRALLVALGPVLLFSACFAAYKALAPAPKNLLSGASWRASSQYQDYEPSGTLEESPRSKMFFCTSRENAPWIILELRDAVLASKLVIENRSDCCDERPVPLVAEVSLDGKKFSEVARRTQPFKVWKTEFASTKFRFLRLRSLKNTYLHFRHVSAFGP